MFNRLVKLEVSSAATGGASFSIEELRVSFRVEKNLLGYPQLAEITVYNLDETHRNQIEEAGLPIQLSAGHADTGIALLFSGETKNVVHEYIKPDWQTKIFSSDAGTAINESTINKSLPAGQTPEQIFDELVGEMQGVTKGLTEGLSICLTGKRSLLRKLMLAGDVKKWLRQLADD